MKKILSAMLTVLLLGCVFGLAGCKDEQASPAGEDMGLVMGKRYIYEYMLSANSTEERAFIFSADGTGKYVYKYESENEINNSHYEIYFKYTYTDDFKSEVICFFDGYKRLDGKTNAPCQTSWSIMIAVSKNVLMSVGSSGYSYYINEDYVATIPNFRVAEYTPA